MDSEFQVRANSDDTFFLGPYTYYELKYGAERRFLVSLSVRPNGEPINVGFIDFEASGLSDRSRMIQFARKHRHRFLVGRPIDYYEVTCETSRGMQVSKQQRKARSVPYLLLSQDADVETVVRAAISDYFKRFGCWGSMSI
jgi:hypothetical protein